MDTEAELTERGHSSPGAGEGRPRSAFARFLAPDGWRRLSPLRGAALLGVACTVFLLLLAGFVVQPFLIPSRSMEPTLRVGDRLLVNKLAYRFGDVPRRGDVVVFDGTGSFVPEPDGAPGPLAGLVGGAASALGIGGPSDTDFVKRVVGVGGDDVVCCDARGRLAVNGVPLAEPYLYPGDAPSKVPFRIVVPLDHLWVMGDHRSQSRDSRDHLGAPGGGMVPVEKVIGRADWIGWPPSRWGRTAPQPGPAAPAPASGGGHG
ncbi:MULTISPECIES: signal peptidase I [Streptomyces]|jgi:signal peptidase I|uniref:signal peptidase I n=1 Tax=Streptomyces TaxID=1883 RepID=UPI002F94DC31